MPPIPSAGAGGAGAGRPGPGYEFIDGEWVDTRKTSRFYCYTYFVESPDYWTPVLAGCVTFHIAQLEVCPSTHRLHWQGYVETASAVRFTQVKRELVMPSANFRVCDGDQEDNIRYCSKLDSRFDAEAEPIRLGVPRTGGRGKRNDIHTAVALITTGAGMEAVLDQHSDVFVRYHRGLTAAAELHQRRTSQARRPELRVKVLTGPPGCGKTRWVYENCPSADLYSLTQSSGTTWWNGYTGQKVLLLDDYYGWIQWGELLRILDIYPYFPQTKGGFCAVSYLTVYITSNRQWDQWYSKSRPFSEQGALQRRIHEVWTFLPDGSHVVSAPVETPVSAHAPGFVVADD